MQAGGRRFDPGRLHQELAWEAGIGAPGQGPAIGIRNGADRRFLKAARPKRTANAERVAGPQPGAPRAAFGYLTLWIGDEAGREGSFPAREVTCRRQLRGAAFRAETTRPAKCGKVLSERSRCVVRPDARLSLASVRDAFDFESSA